MSAASTIPITTATAAMTAGLPVGSSEIAARICSSCPLLLVP